jgi:large subunit ribosomal protein L25
MEYRLKAHYRDNTNPEKLRDAGMLPGVLYNKQINQKVYVDLAEFDKVFRQASIHHVIVLEMPDGSVADTLVRQINLDKRKRRPEHVDFYAVTDQPVDMFVPVKVVGTAPGVRNGGVLDLLHRDIEVRVNPKQVPDFIEVNVSGLNIGDSIHLSDLALPEGVKALMSARETIVAVVPSEDADKLAAAGTAAAEPEVIRKGKTEEA